MYDRVNRESDRGRERERETESLLASRTPFLPSSPPTLCASVLEPYLDLALGEVQSLGQSGPLCRSEILRGIEGFLQLGDLVSGESCPTFPRVLLGVLPVGLLPFSLRRLWREGVGGDWGDGVRGRGVDESRRVSQGTVVQAVSHVGLVAN